MAGTARSPAGRTPVLLAVPGLDEPGLVAACERSGTTLSVVRCCLEGHDLLAAASAGTAGVAVVDATLPQLSRDLVARLALAGVATVGAVAPGDAAAERLLRGLGAEPVVTVDRADPDATGRALAAAVAAALTGDGTGAAAGGRSTRAGYGDVRAALHRRRRPVPQPPEQGPPAAIPPGRLIAVWGPTGGPGRTSVAVTVADELARAGVDALLVDADTYGSAVGPVLGLVDEASGLAVACNRADAGRLDVAALAESSRSVGPGLRVLTGIPRADRWPQLRPAALTGLWQACRARPGVTVVDTGFCLEADEELSYDTAAPRRNAATLTALAAADVLVAVGSADAVGVGRLVEALPQARAAAPSARLRVVVTRVRRSVLGPDPGGQVREALARHAGVTDPVLVPDDADAFDACRRAGRTLAEVAPRSAARRVLAALAAQLAADP